MFDDEGHRVRFDGAPGFDHGDDAFDRPKDFPEHEESADCGCVDCVAIAEDRIAALEDARTRALVHFLDRARGVR